MVADLQVLHPGSGLQDGAAALVAEDHRQRQRPVPVADVQVGVADPGRRDPDPDLTGPRRSQVDLLHLDGGAGSTEHGSTHGRASLRVERQRAVLLASLDSVGHTYARRVHEMQGGRQFYIDGQWVAPLSGATLDIENPATEQIVGQVALAGDEDVDRAVRAARAAAEGWALSSRAERVDLLASIQHEYGRRSADLAAAVTEEMGAPAALARDVHVPSGSSHLAIAIEVLREFPFEELRGDTLLVREPIGVAGLITPWNWPLNQIMCKVAPALATGCTVVLKPSEVAPLSASVFAEVLHAAGLPAGVFNLVHGDGPGAGSALSRHPDVDMVSFTGSTRAGVAVARDAAATVKRVHQELGGKSPLIVLDDDALADGVARGTPSAMVNSGQTCSAPTRLLVPQHRLTEALEVARAVAEELTVGDPTGEVALGPVVSRPAVGEDPGPDRRRPRRGRPAGRRRARSPGRADGRPLRTAHRAGRRHRRDDHRPRGGLRPGARRPRLRGPGRRRRRSPTTLTTA